MSASLCDIMCHLRHAHISCGSIQGSRQVNTTRLTLHYKIPSFFALVVVYQPTMSGSAVEWPVPKSETVPRPVKLSNAFCFEDSQVVLQASRIQVLSPVIVLSF